MFWCDRAEHRNASLSVMNMMGRVIADYHWRSAVAMRPITGLSPIRPNIKPHESATRIFG